MNNDVGMQLYGGLVFVVLGFFAGTIQAAINNLETRFKHRVTKHIVQFLATIVYGIGYILTTHLLFHGEIIYYTIFSTIVGLAIGATVMKVPIRMIISKIVAMNKGRKTAHNKDNDKGEECQTNIDTIKNITKTKMFWKNMTSKRQQECKN